jgi:hypothetical protein
MYVSDSEPERMWKKTIVAKFKIMFWNLPTDTETNHENCHSERLVSPLKFEPGISPCEQDILPPIHWRNTMIVKTECFLFLMSVGVRHSLYKKQYVHST